MLRIGAPWRDCPAKYGPYTTIYNRFNRWSRQGIWLGIFEALTGHGGIWGTVAIDATHIKAHRSAAGAKRGLHPGYRHLARRPHGASWVNRDSKAVWHILSSGRISR